MFVLVFVYHSISRADFIAVCFWFHDDRNKFGVTAAVGCGSAIKAARMRAHTRLHVQRRPDARMVAWPVAHSRAIANATAITHRP